MLSEQQVVDALADFVRLGSVSIREQGVQRPTFASVNLTETRCRTIQSASGWVDYITIQMGEGSAAQGFAAFIEFYTASGKTDPAVSGLQYRFVLDGALMASQEFARLGNVDTNVNHLSSTPFPAQPRRLNLYVNNGSRLVLQVNNTGGAATTAYAGLFGWYLPNTSMPREAQEGTGFGHSDSWHQ